VEFAELPHLPSNYQQALAQLAVLLGGVMVLPNTQQIMQRFQPSWQWAIALSSVTVLCLISLNRVSEFLYFQF
jgi:alginate O-acetyltransferase complex protein AlgI